MQRVCLKKDDVRQYFRIFILFLEAFKFICRRTELITFQQIECFVVLHPFKLAHHLQLPLFNDLPVLLLCNGMPPRQEEQCQYDQGCQFTNHNLIASVFLHISGCS